MLSNHGSPRLIDLCSRDDREAGWERKFAFREERAISPFALNQRNMSLLTLHDLDRQLGCRVLLQRALFGMDQILA